MPMNIQHAIMIQQADTNVHLQKLYNLAKSE
jgi:hypothetical protein